MKATVLIEINQLMAKNGKEDVASHPGIASAPDMAMNLANDINWEVRYLLASNPAIVQLPEVLKQLANDEHFLVRSNLAINPQVAQFPRKTIEILVNDPLQWVRDRVILYLPQIHDEHAGASAP